MSADRPVFGLTVLRYADGRTEVREALDDETPGFHVPINAVVEMPSSWHHRHAMLIDACEVVKRLRELLDERAGQ